MLLQHYVGGGDHPHVRADLVQLGGSPLTGGGKGSEWSISHGRISTDALHMDALRGRIDGRIDGMSPLAVPGQYCPLTDPYCTVIVSYSSLNTPMLDQSLPP